MYLSSAFADILHKPARKKPTITPAESHARNHIGHPFLPLSTIALFFILERIFLSPMGNTNNMPVNATEENECSIQFRNGFWSA